MLKQVVFPIPLYIVHSFQKKKNTDYDFIFFGELEGLKLFNTVNVEFQYFYVSRPLGSGSGSFFSE